MKMSSMNMTKKLIPFGLTSILLVGLLSACNKSEDMPKPTANGSIQAEVDTANSNSQERYSYYWGTRSGSTSTSGSTSGSTSTSTTSLDKQKLLTLVNNVRKTGCNCGGVQMPPVAPLTLNDQLNNAAQGHSNWMLANKTMSHTGANGSSVGTRVTAAGYIWRAVGENVAMGFTSEDAVMKGWLGSSGHCKNIMSANYKELGVGRAGNYWTQNFATKR